ncbi:MAG: MEDS domain-containing protein [Thermoproteota archaeon]|nr:MEDS domain-containing protein [Thermoproteota archaeon]
MTNNEYKDNDKIGAASVNTPTVHQKQVNSKYNTGGISSTVDDIRRSGFQEHNLLIYPDLLSFRQIYSECTKEALENNEVVFLATTYDSFDRIEDALRSKRISVDDEKKNGNLIIVDALRTYQIDTYGAMNFAKDLVMRAARGGKEGVFNLSDMGSFFLSERIGELIGYEQSMPKKMDLKLKATCSYHRDDFGRLAEQQQSALLLGHNTVIGLKELKHMPFNDEFYYRLDG